MGPDIKPPKISEKAGLAKLRADCISTLVNTASQEFRKRCDQSTNQENKAIVPLLDIRSSYSDLKTMSDKIYGHTSVVEIEVTGYAVIKDLMDKFVHAALNCVKWQPDEKKLEIITKRGSFAQFFNILPDEVKTTVGDRVTSAYNIVTDAHEWMTNNEIVDIESFWRFVRDNSRDKYCCDPVAVILWLDVNSSQTEEDRKTQKTLDLYVVYYVVLEISSYVSGMTDDYAAKLYQKFRGQFL